VDHLRIEWTLNPQYHYGWAVPFLCVYLVWRRVQSSKFKVQSSRFDAQDSALNTRRWQFASGNRVHSRSSTFHLLSSILLAALLLPTRLIQEANPEWRLVSWALALEVIGLTLLAACAAGDGRSKIVDTVRHLPSSIFHLRTVAFPVCFFLVAVPWPTLIEGPLIQGLTRANTGATVELLGWLGIPAMPRGNVIEVANGVVGIDEACSGIRSLQATLMISLFLGELYRLSVFRRAVLCLAGFAFAFVFNIARTGLLTWVASRKGVAAIASWHDPAGVTILVGCFIGLWLAALALRQRPKLGGQKAEDGGQQSEDGDRKSEIGGQKSAVSDSTLDPRPSTASFPSTLSPQLSTVRTLAFALFAWLVLVEAGVAAWYHTLESGLPKSTCWHVRWPRDQSRFQEVTIPETTRRLLRYDTGQSGQWLEPDGTRWQVFFCKWLPGRVAGYLAKIHKPEVCLPASGLRLVAATPMRFYEVHGIRLPFRAYTFGTAEQTVHVYYCRWEDRAVESFYATEGAGRYARLRSVWAGRGNCGQRVLEVAVWGIADADAAEAAVRQELEKLIVVEK